MFFDNNPAERELLVKKLDAVMDYKRTLDPDYDSKAIMNSFRPQIGTSKMPKPCPVKLQAFQFLCKLKGISKPVNKAVNLKALSAE